MNRRITNPNEPVSLARKLIAVNWLMLALLCALAAVGLIALYSVSGGAIEPWADRQILRFISGIALVIVISLLPIALWLRLAYPAYALAILLLALVPFVGFEAMGARRWLGTPAFSLQPSELMKIALVLALARYYQWLPLEKVSSPVYVALPTFAILLPVGLTLEQPDLGTALLFAFVGFGTMFLAGVSYLYFLAAGGLAAAAVPVAYGFLHDYQKRRIEVFFNPDGDPLGSGYHITQSKIAFASGGLSGQGYMKGTQSQLNFLPEKHTDFIFTMIGEEWGFIGAVSVLAIYAALILTLLYMALATRNRFARLLIAGASLGLFLYLFINVAMVTGLVPVVGVPLPLVSYGGTSMTTFLIGFGLAMSGYVHREVAFRRQDVGPIW
ncbi:MAG: rod shape-determining protein RodA [Hyphomicrobiaceae bacterium]